MNEQEYAASMRSTNLILFIIRWRKPLIIVAIASVALSYIFSAPLFIKPKYRSTVIVFPTTTNSVSKALLSTDGGNKQDILEFGEEERAEQLLQLLNSDEIRTRIVRKYQLMKHYDIDSTSDYPQTELLKKFQQNIRFERTEFMSVKIDVYDTDAQLAADMANDICALIDSIKNHIQHERAIEGLKIVEHEFIAKQALMKEMEDSLTSIREHGVIDYESQARAIQEEYLKSLSGNSSRARDLKGQLDNFAKYSGSYLSLSELLEFERENLSMLRTKYEQAKVDASAQLTHKFVVNTAYKAERKSYPMRGLIVSVAFLSSMLMAVIAILFIENFRYYKESLAKENIN